MAKTTDIRDERNTGFVARENIAEHKPGFDQAPQERDVEDSGNDRFPRRKQRDVLQRSLAERITKAKK